MAQNDGPIALEDRNVDGGRLFSPSAGRNKAVIAEALSPWLEEGASVLEIGSSTGEHAETLCQARPDISWTPSDPDLRSRESIAARADDCPGLNAPLSLNLLENGWADGLPRFDAIFCANVIHIAPFAVAEAIAAHAPGLLSPRGFVALYGPFLEGSATTPSNLDFDRSLKARNPDWGVRALSDVQALFESSGMTMADRRGMPANNLLLKFGSKA